MKVCNCCGIEKENNYFDTRSDSKDGHRNKCKECRKNYLKNYYNSKEINIFILTKICNVCEMEKNVDCFYKRKASKDGYRNECTDCRKIKLSKNIDIRRIYNREYSKKYMKSRKEHDLLFNLKAHIVDLILKKIKKGGYTKKSRTYDILGCSYGFFKNHIENQFLPGMSWNNRSEWQLDHIYPTSLAKNEQELIMLNHYLNFRTLWTNDNKSKSNNIDDYSINIYDQLIKITNLNYENVR